GIRARLCTMVPAYGPEHGRRVGLPASSDSLIHALFYLGRRRARIDAVLLTISSQVRSIAEGSLIGIALGRIRADRAREAKNRHEQHNDQIEVITSIVGIFVGRFE